MICPIEVVKKLIEIFESAALRLFVKLLHGFFQLIFILLNLIELILLLFNLFVQVVCVVLKEYEVLIILGILILLYLQGFVNLVWKLDKVLGGFIFLVLGLLDDWFKVNQSLLPFHDFIILHLSEMAIFLYISIINWFQFLRIRSYGRILYLREIWLIAHFLWVFFISLEDNIFRSKIIEIARLVLPFRLELIEFWSCCFIVVLGVVVANVFEEGLFFLFNDHVFNALNGN